MPFLVQAIDSREVHEVGPENTKASELSGQQNRLLQG